MYSRKDLILLYKYKDDSYKKALVDRIVCQAKAEVFKAAMQGDTIARISSAWANSKEEVEDLKKEKDAILEQLSTIFKDAIIDIETNLISFVIYQFWEIVVKVNWS